MTAVTMVQLPDNRKDIAYQILWRLKKQNGTRPKSRNDLSTLSTD